MTFDESDVLSPVTEITRVTVHNTLWKEYRHPHPTHIFVHERPMRFDVSVKR
jgi:hypothetical protein